MSGENQSAGYSPASLSKEEIDSLTQGVMSEGLLPVYIDFLSNRPKTEAAREEFRELLRSKFDLKLSDAVERMWELPPLILLRPNDEYIGLLTEARELFTMGYFYSCVAMCGITGERLVKDLLRGSILISGANGVNRPSNEAFDQFERTDANSLVNFLNKAALINDDTKKAAIKLAQLRNDYAHARGKNPQDDAFESIKTLHILVEGTVSVLKDFEIIDGKFIPRTAKI